MTTITLANGRDVDTGCWIDGHHGQYGPDRLADIAEDVLDVKLGCRDDPRVLRKLAELADGRRQLHNWWDAFDWAADRLEERLNDATPAQPQPDGTDRNYYWHWHDGEFFLSYSCDDHDDCTDDTCGNWE